jgi:hypothetical protein
MHVLSSFARCRCDAGDHDRYYGRGDEPVAHENILPLGPPRSEPGNPGCPPVWHGQEVTPSRFAPISLAIDFVSSVSGTRAAQLGYPLAGIDWDAAENPAAAGRRLKCGFVNQYVV